MIPPNDVPYKIKVNVTVYNNRDQAVAEHNETIYLYPNWDWLGDDNDIFDKFSKGLGTVVSIAVEGICRKVHKKLFGSDYGGQNDNH